MGYKFNPFTGNLDIAGGASGAPADATFIVQTPSASLSAEQALSILATGFVKNTTGTGVLSTVANITVGDFASPNISQWTNNSLYTTLAAVNAQNLSVFAATTSLELKGVISDETGSGSLVFGTAPTLTGPVGITEVVGSSGLTITGATQTSSFPALSITQTWNASGTTFSLIKAIVTNTASAGASLLLDLEIGSTVVGSIRRDGMLALRDPANASQTVLTILPQAFNTVFNVAGSQVITLGTGNVSLDNNQAFLLGSTSTIKFNSDTILARDAANTLALRNSTNAQTFNIYNTYTDASNYERGSLAWASNTFTLSNVSAGTGTIRNIRVAAANVLSLESNNNNDVNININGAQRWSFYGGTDPEGERGTFLPATDNAKSIGSTAFRVKKVFIGTALVIDAANIATDTTTGTKIGTATSQKLGFWNTTPIVQPTTAIAAATLVGGGGTTLTDTDTFDGYTVKQVVKALRNFGLLA